MVTSADFIRLPYTTDLTQAGILYACRMLERGLVQTKNSNPDPLRRLVVEVSAEVVFRRWLGENGIPFKSIHASPFSQPLKDDLLVGNRRCHLVSMPVPHYIYHPLHDENLAVFLSAPACLDEAVMNADHLGHPDLLVFAFAGVLPEMSWHERRRTPEGNQRLFLIYLLPDTMQSNPRPWRLTNESQEAIDLELGGWSLEMGNLSQPVHLSPQRAVDIPQTTSRISFLTTQQVPGGSISIQAEKGKRHRISPHHWGNLWVDGEFLLLVGGITVGDFRRRARHSHRLDPPWGDLPLPARVLSLLVEELSPLAEYLSR